MKPMIKHIVPGLLILSLLFVSGCGGGGGGSTTTAGTGNQLGLDGVDDVALHEASASPSSLDLTTFTIEAWVFPTANQNMVIVADSAYFLGTDMSGYVVFEIFTATVTFSTTNVNNPLPLNQWQHIVGIVDDTAKTFRLGINGQLTQPPISYNGVLDTGFSQRFSVGNYDPNAGRGNRPFIGRIDEVRLSNGVRYSNSFPPPPSLQVFSPDANTLGLWHFDEMAGSTSFADSSGNGNPLTGQNGAATVAGDRGS